MSLSPSMILFYYSFSKEQLFWREYYIRVNNDEMHLYYTDIAKDKSEWHSFQVPILWSLKLFLSNAKKLFKQVSEDLNVISL